MIPATLIRGVDPVASIKGGAGSRSAAPGTPLQFNPGDIFSAQIEALLPDGNFKVLVAGQAMSMALPSNLALGDRLELTLVATKPQLTFALKESAPPLPGTVPTLSMAGRQLAALALQPGQVPTPILASQGGPLITTAPADGVRLSQGLTQSLDGSGLFYESHQAEWVAGRRSLDQILQEPQVRLTQSVPRDGQVIQSEVTPLVRQQLAALDSSMVMLQLEVWPKQWMQWAVEERQPEARAEEDPLHGWQTRLRLALPQLGELNATLTLGSDGVRIRLDAASASSAALLQDQRASLHDALAAAGLTAASIVVTHHAPA